MKMLDDPVGSAETARRPLAARPSSLAGISIGILDNSKPNAGVLLAQVAGDLVTRFGASGVRTWQKPGSSIAAAPGVLDEIARSCGVVLTGSAD